jgi:hypothetical protein
LEDLRELLHHQMTTVDVVVDVANAVNKHARWQALTPEASLTLGECRSRPVTLLDVGLALDRLPA